MKTARWTQNSIGNAQGTCYQARARLEGFRGCGASYLVELATN